MEAEQRREQDSKWPALSMLMYGTFGSDTPEGAIYHRQCWRMLIGLTLGEIVLLTLYNVYHLEWLKTASGCLPAVAFAYIAWALRRYLLALDELARRLQLEAMAWTYLCGLPVALLLWGLGITINPLLILVLEPVRGMWLYILSRRY